MKNDSLTFNGSTVMSGAFQEERTADPSAVPEPTMINQNVLYRPGLVKPFIYLYG
ncbi:hypothetical protein PRECH8_04500 [Insulibacter thermoxylanivorax]|uniref:Uncharacterized protein n=1 Tax=Insulibacter thermoxylanivorax TaxID=2749268 RepID=A0A916QCR8_9BACL|nr:hypothetical protein PRECH8_04500 [Insulibacter thermoxylanivorax]